MFILEICTKSPFRIWMRHKSLDHNLIKGNFFSKGQGILDRYTPWKRSTFAWKTDYNLPGRLNAGINLRELLVLQEQHIYRRRCQSPCHGTHCEFFPLSRQCSLILIKSKYVRFINVWLKKNRRLPLLFLKNIQRWTGAMFSIKKRKNLDKITCLYSSNISTK